LNSLRTFYAALGIEFTEEQHGDGPVHYAGRLGDVVFEIYPLSEDGPVADATTRLGFSVENMTKVVAALQTLGVAVVSPPQSTEWGCRAVVRDPDGRAVELYQR